MALTTRRALAGLAAALAGALVALLALAPGAAAGGTVPAAWVRLVHLASAPATASLAVGDEVLTAAPGEASAYAAVAPGEVPLVVTGPDGSPLVTGTASPASGEAVTAAVVEGADGPALLVVPDPLAPPAAGTARVRVLAGGALPTAVDVVAVGGPVLARGAQPASASEPLDVPAGPWTAVVTAAGGQELARADVELAVGAVHTILVTTGAGGASVDVLRDAVGSAVVPVGGAATGYGGTAGALVTAGSPALGALLAAALVAGAVLLVAPRHAHRS